MMKFTQFLSEPILYHGTTSNFDMNKGLLAGGNGQVVSNFEAGKGEIWLTSNRDVAFEYALIAWKMLKDFSLTPILLQVDMDVRLSADQPIENGQESFCFELPIIPKNKLKIVKLTPAELTKFEKRRDREVNLFKQGKSNFRDPQK